MSEKKMLKIIVLGAAMSGKTTLSAQITKMLHERGFEMHVTPTMHGDDEQVLRLVHDDDQLTTRVNELLRDSAVHIEERQSTLS